MAALVTYKTADVDVQWYEKQTEATEGNGAGEGMKCITSIMLKSATSNNSMQSCSLKLISSLVEYTMGYLSASPISYKEHGMRERMKSTEDKKYIARRYEP